MPVTQVAQKSGSGNKTGIMNNLEWWDMYMDIYGYFTHIYLHRVLDVATTLGYHGLTGYHLNSEKFARLAADAMPFEHLAPASCKFLALTPRKRHPTVKSKHCVPSCCFIFWKQYRTSCKYKLSTINLGRSAHSMKATCSNLKHMVMKHSHAQLKVTHELIYPRFQSEHLIWRFHLTGFTTSNVNGVTQTNAVMIAE